MSQPYTGTQLGQDMTHMQPLCHGGTVQGHTSAALLYTVLTCACQGEGSTSGWESLEVFLAQNISGWKCCREGAGWALALVR